MVGHDRGGRCRLKVELQRWWRKPRCTRRVDGRGFVSDYVIARLQATGRSRNVCSWRHTRSRPELLDVFPHVIRPRVGGGICARRSVEFRVASEMCTIRSQGGSGDQSGRKLLFLQLIRHGFLRLGVRMATGHLVGPMVGPMGMTCITGKENPG